MRSMHRCLLSTFQACKPAAIMSGILLLAYSIRMLEANACGREHGMLSNLCKP